MNIREVVDALIEIADTVGAEAPVYLTLTKSSHNHPYDHRTHSEVYAVRMSGGQVNVVVMEEVW